MRIGELAEATGCNVVTIRYYERIGVLTPAVRRANNYRDYDASHLRRLRFVCRMRALGFSLAQVRQFLDLIDKQDYSCEQIRAIAQEHLDAVRDRRRDMERMEATLVGLLGECQGGDSPDCSLLERLFDDPTLG